MIHLNHYLFEINVYYQQISHNYFQKQKELRLSTNNEAISSEQYKQMQLDDDHDDDDEDIF
jgi:hypothetical protein